MSSLTAMFRGPAQQPANDDRLLELYQNRNELKKEFARLRDEQYRLRDRLKEEQGAHARTQQMFEHLEDLLLDADSARNVVVYYQLRAASLRCQRYLERFAEQIKQKREKKVRDKALSSWNEGLRRELRALELQITDRRATREQLEHERDIARRRLAAMTGLHRFFRRREQKAAIDAMTAEIHSTEDLEHELHAQAEEIRARTPPETAGLDIAAKRSINCMILAYAQQLYVQFGSEELVAMVKEVGEKSAGTISYGNAEECERILQKVRAGLSALDGATEFADVLQRRARLLAEGAHYSADSDAVPLPGSVATLYRIDQNGTVHASDVDILGGNYWDISTVFSR